MSDRTFEQWQALLTQVMERHVRVASGTGRGTVGSTATIRLDRPLAGQNTVQAICLTAIPPGRVQLLQDNTGCWYAVAEQTATPQQTQVSQYRRSSQQAEQPTQPTWILFTITDRVYDVRQVPQTTVLYNISGAALQEVGSEVREFGVRRKAFLKWRNRPLIQLFDAQYSAGDYTALDAIATFFGVAPVGNTFQPVNDTTAVIQFYNDMAPYAPGNPGMIGKYAIRTIVVNDGSTILDETVSVDYLLSDTSIAPTYPASLDPYQNHLIQQLISSSTLGIPAYAGSGVVSAVQRAEFAYQNRAIYTFTPALGDFDSSVLWFNPQTFTTRQNGINASITSRFVPLTEADLGVMGYDYNSVTVRADGLPPGATLQDIKSATGSVVNVFMREVDIAGLEDVETDHFEAQKLRSVPINRR